MQSAAVASAIFSPQKRKALISKLSKNFSHLRLEKEKLEHDLTTRFPCDGINFDEDLEMLTMDG